MKKKFTIILSLTVALALCALLFAGCGQNDSSSDSGSQSASDSSSNSTSGSSDSDANSDSTDGEGDALDFSAGLDDDGHLVGLRALDYVTLPTNYKAIPVPAGELDVTEEEVQDQISTLLSGYSYPEQVTDRAIEDGEYVNIDYSGSIDGEKFDGGTAEGQRVLSGSNQFIDDFLTQIIGHTPGETFSVEVTFPEPYENNPDLAGKDAVFEVTVNYIEGETVTPDFTDDFVKENLSAQNGWETAEAAKTDISNTLRESKLSDFVWKYLEDSSSLTETPAAALEFQKQMLINQITSQASMFGLSLDDFLSGMGIADRDALFEQSAAELEQGAKQQIIMQAIMEAEALEVTDEILAAYFKDEMNEEDYSPFEEYYGRGYLALVVQSEQIDNLLTDGAQT